MCRLVATSLAWKEPAVRFSAREMPASKARKDMDGCTRFDVKNIAAKIQSKPKRFLPEDAFVFGRKLSREYESFQTIALRQGAQPPDPGQMHRLPRHRKRPGWHVPKRSRKASKRAREGRKRFSLAAKVVICPRAVRFGGQL